MPQGPSLTEQHGRATLEGKLKLSSMEQDGGILSAGQTTEFETALTATVCLKIANYSFSGAQIENINLQKRVNSADDNVSIAKTLDHMAYAKNIHFRF